MLYESREQYSQAYKDKDSVKINRILTKRKIDINEIINYYENGYSLNNIKVLFKLSDDQLSYILDNYIPKKMDRIRQENKQKWKDLKVVGFGTNVKELEENKKNTREKLKEAISLVEGNEGIERED